MPKATEQDQADKRYELIQQLNNLIFSQKINMVITEGIFFNSNASTHEKLSKFQGCIQDFCRAKNIVCFSFNNAGEWRKWISIKARDRKTYKTETKRYVIEKYGLSDDLAEDIYDAVGIGTAYYVMLENKGLG